MKFSSVILMSLISLVGLSCESTHSPDLSQADVILHTDVGDIYLQLFEETPEHRANFLKLCQTGFLDSTAFHRVVYEFVVQGGDPRTRNQYPPRDTSLANDAGYELEPEFVDSLAHLYGMLGAAREPDSINPFMRSSSSQFYIVTGKPVALADLNRLEANRREAQLNTLYEAFEADTAFEGNFAEYQEQLGFEGFRYTAQQRKVYLKTGGAPNLDGRYTLFGKMIAGKEAVRKIEISATTRDIPIKPIYILSAEVLSASATP